ncbi:MAG: peptidylprolyl isomerase, partial [FCB group bacterium]|nr:peptidylprolyl isomerase [FCB group bacterium]
REVAPNHVQNFLELVDQGFYNGLTFHRVVPGFIIQGGDPEGDGTGHAGYLIPAEFSNLKHMPGTLSMARGTDPNSASCQFFICLGQLPDLDDKYTIFGQVVEGMKVANEIAKVEVKGNRKLKERSMPVEPVRMIQVWQAGSERPVLETDSPNSDG